MLTLRKYRTARYTAVTRPKTFQLPHDYGSTLYVLNSWISDLSQQFIQILRKYFVASLTRRFVSAKRLFRDLQNSWANSLSITPKVPSQILDVSSLALYRIRIPNRRVSRICERDIKRDAQRVCLRILKVSEESLGRDETPRQTSHELFSHKYLTIILL